MSTPQTPDELLRLITSDFNWRLKELSALKLAVGQSDSSVRVALIRAVAVMSYAHWEGHVKLCGTKYMAFLVNQQFLFEEMNDHFYALHFFPQLDGFFNSKPSAQRKVDFVKNVLTLRTQRLSETCVALIDTRSNLNSAVLKDICLICGIEHEIFVNDFDWIDKILVNRRNSVAHGAAFKLDIGDLDGVVERTLRLMRYFREQIENVVSNAGYRKAA